MTFVEIKEIAKGLGIRTAGVKKTDIVRAIQLHEGNSPCFATGRAAACGQLNCCWLDACE